MLLMKFEKDPIRRRVILVGIAGYWPNKRYIAARIHFFFLLPGTHLLEEKLCAKNHPRFVDTIPSLTTLDMFELSV